MPYGRKFSTTAEKVAWLRENQLETCKRLVMFDELGNWQKVQELEMVLHVLMVRAKLLSKKTYWLDVPWDTYCDMAIAGKPKK
jgi:hypothetical protein